MKIHLFLLIIIFKFSLSNESKLTFQRKLENNKDKQIIIIGFGNYSFDIDNAQGTNLSFKVYFKRYYFPENITSFNSTFRIIYDNTTEKDIEIECSNISKIEQEEHDFVICKIDKDNDPKNITTVQLKNYTLIFVNKNENNTITEDEIVLSSLANETRFNISEETNNLTYGIFDLDSTYITKNEITLNGNLNETNIINNFSLYLNLSGIEYNCSFINNNETSDEIKFSPTKSINEHLNGKMAKAFNNSAENKYYILLYVNHTDDLILYSINTNSYIELVGFGNYKHPSKSNAEVQAYLRGTYSSLRELKKNLYFTANLDDGTPVSGNGTRNDNDIINSIITYNVTFYDTSNKTINKITFKKDFKFYDDNDYANSIEQINVYPDDYNITNSQEFLVEEIKSISKPNYGSNSFSFNFNFPQNSEQSIEKFNKTKAYMTYIPLDKEVRDEIECSIENRTTTFVIDCNPKKDVYTFINTLKVNIPKGQSTKRLRFLASTENSTFYAPSDAEGTIEITYDPAINTFGRKASKNKGLSGGAIAAIVLASIAAIAAVGIAIFFLNRMPVNPPIKPTSELQLQNSSVKIQS